MLIYAIRDEKEFKALEKRVNKGVQYLKDKWHDPKFEREVEHFKAMAVAVLNWQIDCGIINKKFDKWLVERGY